MTRLQRITERNRYRQNASAYAREGETEVPASDGRMSQVTGKRLRAAADSLRRVIQMNRSTSMLAREGIGIQRLPAPVKPSLPQRSFVDRVLARLEADLRAAEEARDEANIRWMQATCRGEGDASDDRRLAYYQAVATCDRINHDINLIQDEAAR